METTINVTPEVIERLRRLAILVSKKGNSPRNGEKKKKELDPNGNDSGKVKDTSNGGIVLDTNGGLSPEVNGTENDVPTPGNKQTKGEGAIKMDKDVFRQVLKEVIIKRTAAIEKRVMGDVEALKNQVSELEAQKKILQCDSERLQQTLNEISSKHEKQKVQMISCGTQVDMDLIQERPLSPEISKPVKPMSFSEKAIALKQMQNSKIVNTKQAVSDQVIAYKIDENEEKTSDRTKTPESRIHCDDSGIGLAQNVSVAGEDATKTLSAKDAAIEILRRVSSQEQRRTTETLATRDQQNELHVRQTQTTEFPHAPSIHRPNSELRVEGPRAGQEQRNIYQQSARVDMLQHTQTHGLPPPRPTVSSGNPLIRGQNQVYFPMTSTESPLPHRPQFSSTRWLASQSQQPNQQVQASGNGNVQPQQHPSVNNSPLERANHSSIDTFPRGPPNVSLFQAPKRRRVENVSASNGLHMHVVSSNNNYVMHNFKVKQTPTPRALGGEHGKKYVQISGPVSANQVVSPTTSSNQLARSYLTQSVPNSQPGVYPAQYPFHATNKPPGRPSAGRSQGQPVETVFYPSNGSQPGSNEYHNAQRVMSTHHQRYNERVQATDQPAEPNGTVYVVKEYQVSRTRSAPLQAIAPAPPAVLRNATCPPVQSPGITSTASPSGPRPGEANAALVPRPVSNPSDTPAVRSSGPHLHLKMPPKPTASIVVVQDGIVLSWNMQLDEVTAKIDNYELFACQDGVESTNPPIMWKKIGIVKALPLPMACTLTQFSSGNKYHFAVRAVDNQERAGPFSDPCTISLTN